MIMCLGRPRHVDNVNAIPCRCSGIDKPNSFCLECFCLRQATVGNHHAIPSRWRGTDNPSMFVLLGIGMTKNSNVNAIASRWRGIGKPDLRLRTCPSQQKLFGRRTALRFNGVSYA